MKKCLLLALLISIEASAQESYWTYYNTWCMGDSSQWNLAGAAYYMPTRKFTTNLGKITHVIIFPGRDILRGDYSPYLSCSQEYINAGGSINDSIDVLYNGIANPQSGYSKWISRGCLYDLIDDCHAKGVKVLLCVNAVSPAIGWNAVATDSAKTQAFANVLARYLNTHNFDGADINVEGSPTTTTSQTERFYRIVRRAIGDTKLLTAVPPITRWTWFTPTCITYIDYVLPQHYAYSANWDPNSCNPDANTCFLKAPLRRDPYPAGSNHQDITTWGPNQWYAAGWPKNKIVILLSNEAILYRDVDAMFSCLSSNGTFWADTCARYMLTNGGTLHWDSVHVGEYISGTAINAFKTIAAGQKFYIITLSKKNLEAVVTWGRENGYANFGLYDVSTDVSMRKSSPMVLHDHLSSVLNTGKSCPTASLIIATPDKITANGTGSSLILVQMKDADGNDLQTGGDIVMLSATLGTLSAVSDHGDGSYSAMLTSGATTGTATISGTLNSQAMENTANVIIESILPVQLTSFNGVAKGNTIELTWSTATEINSNIFHIERHIYANWEKIGEVPAGGTSNTPREYSFVDNLQKNSSGSIRYRLKTMNNDGSFEYSSELEIAATPVRYSLGHNYPNPFNPQTKIQYSLSENAKVQLYVYDLLGREVFKLVNEEQPAGYYEKVFNGSGLSSGVYFYRMITQVQRKNTFSKVKRMLLVK